MVGIQVADSLRALLAHSVDYAGLFPPAALDLEPALKNYISYLGSKDHWMLSSFVLPMEKFGDAGRFISVDSETGPLRISALGPKTLNAGDFLEKLETAIKGIEQFQSQDFGLVKISQMEMPLFPGADAGSLKQAAQLIAGRTIDVFWELPLNEVGRLVPLLAQCNQELIDRPFGFKIRTGGVSPDAFPSARCVAEPLLAAANYRVRLKFTAGLHHPVRMFRDEVKTKMHGFLNVFGAGVLALEHGWDAPQIASMLEDENAGSFAFDDGTFRWRNWQVESQSIETHRRLITSFGSCSFDEPREDLQSLGLL